MEDPTVDHCGRRLTALWLCALYKRSLRIQCAACSRVAIVSAFPLWWRWSRRGWDETIKAVHLRLYCRECWRRTARKVRPRTTVTLDEPTTDLGLRWPDEREWKRMVSRYRG